MIGTWWLVGLVWAAEPVTLEEAWARAADGPEAAAAAVEAELGRAERREAAAWSNPTLSYQGFGRVRGTADAINGQQHQVALGLPLPVTGELASRLRRGRLAEQLGEARSETRRALLGEAVGAAWLELLAAQEREAVLARVADRVDDLVEHTRLRAEQGAARPFDLDRMRLARVSVERRLAAAVQERLDAAARLGALLGRGDAELEARGDLADPLVLPDGGESPFVTEARRVLAHREEAVREARRSRVPEPSLQIGGYWTTDGDSTSVLAGLDWDLPVIDRGQGRVATARAEEAAAAAELRRVEAEVAAEIEALRGAVARLAEAAARLPPEDRAVVAAAEVAWREGETGVFELVDAVFAALDERLEAVDVLLALRRAELRLALLEGRLNGRVGQSTVSSSQR